MKLLPMISAIIPVIITLSVFDNALLSDTASNTINKTSKIYQNYIGIRGILLTQDKLHQKISPIKTYRNTEKLPDRQEIASNWKSSTLLQ